MPFSQFLTSAIPTLALRFMSHLKLQWAVHYATWNISLKQFPVHLLFWNDLSSLFDMKSIYTWNCRIYRIYIEIYVNARKRVCMLWGSGKINSTTLLLYTRHTSWWYISYIILSNVYFERIIFLFSELPHSVLPATVFIYLYVLLTNQLNERYITNVCNIFL